MSIGSFIKLLVCRKALVPFQIYLYKNQASDYNNSDMEEQ